MQTLTISGSTNSVTVSGVLTPATISSSANQVVISGSLPVLDLEETSTTVLVSGTNIVVVQETAIDVVEISTGGTGDVTEADLTTVSGHLQSQINSIDVDEVEPAIVGTDGITVLSGTSTTTLVGFRSEFVSASGSLQSQISALDSSVTLQDVYDNGTGQILTSAGKPVVVSGSGGLGVSGTLYVREIQPEQDSAFSLGSPDKRFYSLFLQANNDVVISLPDASTLGEATDYTVLCGGGDSVGGTFRFLFSDISIGAPNVLEFNLGGANVGFDNAVSFVSFPGGGVQQTTLDFNLGIFGSDLALESTIGSFNPFGIVSETANLEGDQSLSGPSDLPLRHQYAVPRDPLASVSGDVHREPCPSPDERGFHRCFQRNLLAGRCPTPSQNQAQFWRSLAVPGARE